MDENSEHHTRIQWHPAFCAAMRLELKDDTDRLTFHEEFVLGKKPMQADLLIDMIEIKGNEPLHNEIGGIFKRFNLIEYKSPGDALGIGEYHRLMTYAFAFLSTSGLVDVRRSDQVTLTFVRENKPKALMAHLRNRMRLGIENPRPGIYEVTEHPFFSLQFIVSSELTAEDHTWLTALSRRLDEKAAGRLLTEIEALQDEQERDNGDAVLNVAENANQQVFNSFFLEERNMYECLRKYYEPEIQHTYNTAYNTAYNKAYNDALSVGEARGKAEGIDIGRSKVLQAMKDLGYPQEEIDRIMNYPQNQN